VKQGCESKQFIAINDKEWKWLPGFLYQTEDEGGREQDSGETERGV